ncbi:parathyroid hormone/parathyroid hormone-related peptide receptor-like [Babylonia areolata]|uniref:parathyroid hormone/parathyroid hormone-related peptide receptor-like n=1 Tax=Babylonia areolata TaxID=304850 RepID=UPI003FCFC85B
MAIFWILKGPMLVSVLVNFVFFVNIVRVLFTKLVKTAPPRARRFRYRRLAKSTLVLIPVFGLHYILFLGLPEKVSPAAELVKLYYEMFFNSFQGFFVACLFCFMNGEVKAEICKKWIRYKLRTNSRRFQRIYYHHQRTSSSHLSRKRSRRLSSGGGGGARALGLPGEARLQGPQQLHQLRELLARGPAAASPLPRQPPPPPPPPPAPDALHRARRRRQQQQQQQQPRGARGGSRP